jgi:starch synthase
MKVLFVASECTPIAKVGGLGDVIGSLPKALKKLGLDVKIVIPKYQVIDEKKYHFDLIAQNIKFKDELINVYQGFLPDSQVVVYLLDNNKYFGENGVYLAKSAFVDSFKEIQRFLFFSKAIPEIFKYLDWQPQIIHCQDWHTALIPLLLKTKYRAQNIKTLLTIHNLANQGKWIAGEILSFLGLKGNEAESLKIIDKEGKISIFEQGILNADILNTVSQNYAQEIKTKEFGEGLEQDLIKRQNDLFGIINGIDYERFNPETDPDIKTNYSFNSLEKRTENKIDLQKTLKLPENQQLPLLSIINRLTSQKGVDLVIGIIPELVKLNCQLVVLGVGEDIYEKKLLEFSLKYPSNISCQIKFDPVLAQKIYAGSDIFLMPSKFEPCGLGQMIAMRYGAIPIVRKTGGLAETVENQKTGFVFEDYKKDALLKSLKECLDAYSNRDKWVELMKRAMNQDFSWQKSAKRYVELYKNLTSSKP